MNAGLKKIFGQLQDLGGELTDGQLLARFLATRDEGAFAVLVRRHGAMVLGVCRRILHDVHDAEDAFQASFLILARKAASVTRRESIGCWLHAVAHNAAVEAARANARRRARERQVKDMPHPSVAAAEPSCESVDWRPLLDHELGRLSEKCRAAVVLCDLEGRSQRQAARLLGNLPQHIGQPSGERPPAAGKALERSRSGGVGQRHGGAAGRGSCQAQVPATLVMSTARVAALVAAGQMAAGSTPAVLLMKGVMQMMLLKKLRLVLGAIMVVAALGAIGFASRSGDQARAQDVAVWQVAGGDAVQVGSKPVSELETLRKEVALLRLNNNILLEKIGALEAQAKSPHLKQTELRWKIGEATQERFEIPLKESDIEAKFTIRTQDPAIAVEAALKAFREASSPEEKQRAAQVLEQATKKLREQVGPETSAPQVK